MRTEYFIIHNGKEYYADNFESAIEKGEDLTYGEEKHETALIFIRHTFECDSGKTEVRIELQGLRWLYGRVFELVNLHL